jgi:hypothetical protein
VHVDGRAGHELAIALEAHGTALPSLSQMVSLRYVTAMPTTP